MPDPAEAPSDDWSSQAADTVIRVVDVIRTNTADRLESVARFVVYGLLAAVLGLTSLILLAIGAVRVLDVYLPFRARPARGVWVADVTIGGLFALGGLVCWRLRRPDSAE